MLRKSISFVIFLTHSEGPQRLEVSVPQGSTVMLLRREDIRGEQIDGETIEGAQSLLIEEKSKHRGSFVINKSNEGILAKWTVCSPVHGSEFSFLFFLKSSSVCKHGVFMTHCLNYEVLCLLNSLSISQTFLFDFGQNSEHHSLVYTI